MQGIRSRVVLVGMLMMLLASPTSALDCRDWSQLYSSPVRRAAIEDQVWTILESGSASSWNVNHNKIGRCVMRRARQLEDEIDDICDQGMRASMQAVDEMIEIRIVAKRHGVTSRRGSEAR